MATKTVTLTGAEQRVDELGGLNALIVNNTNEPLYASAKAGVTPYVDGVIEIKAGASRGLPDTNGTVYLLGNGGRAELTGTSAEVNFNEPLSSSGDGGGLKEYVDERDAVALDSAKKYADSKSSALNKKITTNASDIDALENRLPIIQRYPTFKTTRSYCRVGIGFTDNTWLNTEDEKSFGGLAANLYGAVIRLSVSFDISAITALGKTAGDIRYVHFYNLGSEFLSKLSGFGLIDIRTAVEIYGRTGSADFARPTVIGYLESPAPTDGITVGEETVFPLNVCSYTQHSLENGFYLNCSINKFYYTSSQTVTASFPSAIAFQPDYETASFTAMPAAALTVKDVREYPPDDLPDEGDTDLDQTDF